VVPAYATITKIDCPYVIDPRNKLDPYGSHVRQPKLTVPTIKITPPGYR
jgi:hypothetical protein